MWRDLKCKFYLLVNAMSPCYLFKVPKEREWASFMTKKLLPRLDFMSLLLPLFMPLLAMLGGTIMAKIAMRVTRDIIYFWACHVWFATIAQFCDKVNFEQKIAIFLQIQASLELILCTFEHRPFLSASTKIFINQQVFASLSCSGYQIKDECLL